MGRGEAAPPVHDPPHFLTVDRVGSATGSRNPHGTPSQPTRREPHIPWSVGLVVLVVVAVAATAPEANGEEDHARDGDESDDEEEGVGHGAQRIARARTLVRVAISERVATMALTMLARHGRSREAPALGMEES